jgi:hypothetical protein
LLSVVGVNAHFVFDVQWHTVTFVDIIFGFIACFDNLKMFEINDTRAPGRIVKKINDYMANTVHHLIQPPSNSNTPYYFRGGLYVSAVLFDFYGLSSIIMVRILLNIYQREY